LKAKQFASVLEIPVRKVGVRWCFFVRFWQRLPLTQEGGSFGSRPWWRFLCFFIYLRLATVGAKFSLFLH